MRIILNADDFGYSQDTVAATIGCFDRGLLTSATIMPTGAATSDALEYAREHSEASFGVHLTWVGDGSERPATEPRSVRSLVDGEGCLRRTNRTRLRALAHLLPVEEIERETQAQIELVAKAGIPVSHVDSHRHLHKLAPFRAALSAVLPRCGVARVRRIQDVYLGRPALNATYWLAPVWRRRILPQFESTDHFYMPATAHDRDWHRVVTLLPQLSGSTIEIGLHPGNAEEWRRFERDSLPRFVDAAVAAGNELITWRAVTS